MKKLTWTSLFVSAAMLFTVGTGFASAEGSGTGHVDPEYTITIPYDYPVRPGTPEWAEFTDHQQMVDACEIPEDILHSMTTEALVDTVLDYPLFMDMDGYDSFQHGFEIMSSHSNAILELLSRDNAGTFLLGRLSQKRNARAQASFSQMDFILEALLAQESVTDDMNHNERAALSDEMLITYGAQPTTESVYFRILAEQQNGGPLKGISPRISVYTPKGTSVEVFTRPEYMTTGDGRYHDAILLITKNYPLATILKNPSSTYNCHSYAWYSQSQGSGGITAYWMNSPANYWGDRSYIPIAVPKANDKIFYSSDHSGVIVDASRRIVNSKWGDGCVVQHVETYCKYWYSSVQKTYYTRSY